MEMNDKKRVIPATHSPAPPQWVVSELAERIQKILLSIA
jgi:hypothetical protein